MAIWNSKAAHSIIYASHINKLQQYKADIQIEAIAAPTLNDDVALYGEGTIWIEQDSDTAWLCLDNASAAAVWIAFDQSVREADHPRFDYVTITGTNGTLNLEAAVWDDLMISVLAAKPGPANPPSFEKWKDNGAGSTGVYLYFFPPSAIDDLFFCVQMPHEWKLGSEIHPHVHWIPKTTADGTPANQKVRWGLEYTFVEIGGTFGNTSIIYGADHLPPDADVIAGKHYITSFSAITPTASQDGLSSMMVCRLFRDSTNPADNYEHDAGLLQFDLHYQIDQMGSRQEFIK